MLGLGVPVGVRHERHRARVTEIGSRGVSGDVRQIFLDPMAGSFVMARGKTVPLAMTNFPNPQVPKILEAYPYPRG